MLKSGGQSSGMKKKLGLEFQKKKTLFMLDDSESEEEENKVRKLKKK